MKPALISLALLCLLGACAPKVETQDAPKESTLEVEGAKTGGFSPLGTREINIEGHGTWECSPISQERQSGCAPLDASSSSSRPGALPVRPSLSIGAPGIVEEGARVSLPDFEESSEIPMSRP